MSCCCVIPEIAVKVKLNCTTPWECEKGKKSGRKSARERESEREIAKVKPDKREGMSDEGGKCVRVRGAGAE